MRLRTRLSSKKAPKASRYFWSELLHHGGGADVIG
uniref:Uncharacterized protein n=1 Tax=Siphoviridae sp. ctXQ014 TaxID=2825542 RepID=A0A8S5PP13_9CAUD|nr:MAG TPA: hypothetical protein [Siphoviridae sp. ctXQ014]